MLYRKVVKQFEEWKKDNKVLLVYGARQVGKTYLIRDFGKNNFDNFYEINFAEDSQALNILLEVTDYNDFLLKLSLIVPSKLKASDLLFFDEIQIYYQERQRRIDFDPSYSSKYTDILTLAKTIADKGEFRFVMSGSLLGISIFNTKLNPTGYVKEIMMYPLDFEEFLLASNISEDVIAMLKDCFYNKTPVTPYLNEMMLEKFREYAIVGGMPQVVDYFVNRKNYRDVTSSQREIINWYHRDIIKYCDIKDRLVVSSVYELLPSEISAKNKKFVKTHLDLPNAKNIDLNDRYLWLSQAGIAIPVYNCHNPVYPLKISQDYKIVKLFANDVGLLTNMIFESDSLDKIVLTSKDDVDFGSIYENAVAEILLTHGFNPYFYSLKKDGEVDFLITKNTKIIPLEIKSGKGGEQYIYEHNALDKMLLKHSEIETAFVFGNTNVFKENEKIFCFPIYMIDFLSK